MADSTGTRRQPLHLLARKATSVLRAEVNDALDALLDSSPEVTLHQQTLVDISGTGSNPLPFLTVLEDQLEAIGERLNAGTQTEDKIRELLAALERLSTWPASFQPPPTQGRFNFGSYPRLHRLASHQKPYQRLAQKSIVELAASGEKGRRERKAFRQSFRAFAPIETPPRGSEISQLRNVSPREACAGDAASECLRELHATLCQLAHCPKVSGIQVGHFKVNVSLSSAPEPTGSGDDVILEMFILHGHVEGGRASGNWRETRIRALLQGSAIKFQQVGEKIAELCTLVRDRDPSRVKLSASNNGLFQEGLELPGEPRISLRAPSVSLARLLPSASMRTDEQRRLLLSYLLAKAVWTFYDLAWMTEYWTKDAVHFMRQHLDGLESQQPMAPLSHQPFIQADLRPLEPWVNMTPQGAAGRKGGRTHILPKILALGIVLLEIELGRALVVPDFQESPDLNDQQRANAAHIAAYNVLNSPEWEARQKRAFRPLVTAIEICIKPDTSRLDLNGLRDSLYNTVVRPLENLFSTMWLSEGQRPETFTPDPIEFDEVGAPSCSEIPASKDAEYSPVLAGVPPSSYPQIATRQRLQPLYSLGSNPSHDSHHPLHQSEHAEDKEGHEDDCPLFGAEDGYDVPAALCDQADKWVKAFKILRTEFRIGREPQRIKVAILDTGADANHQDFLGKPIVAYKSFLDGGDARVDPSGHGTHIAGIILDLTSNVELYIAQVTDSRLSVNRDRIVKALRWARTEWRVNMVSMSFGYRKTGGPDTVKKEVGECLKDNIVVFSSASNDGANMPRTYPAKYEQVLCIHSATGQGSCSGFNPTAESRRDNFTVLGDGIKSSWPRRSEGDIGYRHMSGTSFATPIAVSIAAFAIGYIRVNLGDLGWNTEPLSPDGVRTIFYVMSTGNQKEGYDLVYPTWFFKNREPNLIREMLKDELGGYEL